MGVRTVLLLPILSVTVLVVAQSSRQPTSPSDSPLREPVIRTAQQNTFKTSSVLPDCYTYAVERGDPEAGPSVTYSKLAAGCKVPWHTHSANAQVLFVSGTFQLHMKGQQVQILSQGSYAYVPANHQHQETCLNGCTYYVIREGVADVHYVDAAGREISPDIALAAVGERPAAAIPTRE
ncbi:MAG TPA: cupin domain-containing protein [Terriglobales bacterium]|jgi:quercetin dioxygenase-like cupin family protein|nr:cupin domain-containing protein [Terriglobales bacterium]